MMLLTHSLTYTRTQPFIVKDRVIDCILRQSSQVPKADNKWQMVVICKPVEIILKQIKNWWTAIPCPHTRHITYLLACGSYWPIKWKTADSYNHDLLSSPILPPNLNCKFYWPVTTRRQCLVSCVTRAWGWSSVDTEHLSRPGQRAGKPGLVTSVTSHSAPDHRSRCPGTGPW